VIESESRIDQMEIEIDADCVRVIAMRQPIASDLRYVLAITKITANLERAGDEAERVARRTKHIMEDSFAASINIAELKVAGDLASSLLKRSLDAFARQDALAAQKIIQDDRALDQEFRAFVRKLTSYMSEDPRSIKVCLDFLTVAKAIERIGDHATNIAEQVVYQVYGKDIRHSR
jgi:phosphate transport system protein